jgi:hypothetical protein
MAVLSKICLGALRSVVFFVKPSQGQGRLTFSQVCIRRCDAADFWRKRWKCFGWLADAAVDRLEQSANRVLVGGL